VLGTDPEIDLLFASSFVFTQKSVGEGLTDTLTLDESLLLFCELSIAATTFLFGIIEFQEKIS
jgi:hypothetical protein